MALDRVHLIISMLIKDVDELEGATDTAFFVSGFIYMCVVGWGVDVDN